MLGMASCAMVLTGCDDDIDEWKVSELSSPSIELAASDNVVITMDNMTKVVLNINYEVGDVGIDWENAAAIPFEYTPGKVEFQVTQMPSVEIEYTGGPIYVTARSDPDYQPTLDARG